MYYKYDWMENLNEAYHKLNITQIDLLRKVYKKMMRADQGKLNLWRLLAVVDTHFTSLSIANSTGARNRGFKLPISGKFKYRIFGESFS